MKGSFLHHRSAAHGVPVGARAGRSTLSRRSGLTHRLASTCTIACLSVAALLTGCATQTPPQQKTLAPAARTTAHSAFQGRFSVRYADQNQRVQNAYGNFDWLEQGDEVTLSLRSPLGSTLAIVGSTPTQATLELPNQQPRTATNVEDLMRGALGFPLPVSGMRYWLKDSPSPESHAQIVRDAQGRITQIVQDGWRIDYLAFGDAPSDAPPATQTAGAGAATSQAPSVRRMNLTRIDAPSNAPLDVRIVLNP